MKHKSRLNSLPQQNFEVKPIKENPKEHIAQERQTKSTSPRPKIRIGTTAPKSKNNFSDI